jgi:hypothetical protein
MQNHRVAFRYSRRGNPLRLPTFLAGLLRNGACRGEANHPAQRRQSKKKFHGFATPLMPDHLTEPRPVATGFLSRRIHLAFVAAGL